MKAIETSIEQPNFRIGLQLFKDALPQDLLDRKMWETIPEDFIAPAVLWDANVLETGNVAHITPRKDGGVTAFIFRDPTDLIRIDSSDFVPIQSSTIMTQHLIDLPDSAVCADVTIVNLRRTKPEKPFFTQLRRQFIVRSDSANIDEAPSGSWEVNATLASTGTCLLPFIKTDVLILSIPDSDRIHGIDDTHPRRIAIINNFMVGSTIEPCDYLDEDIAIKAILNVIRNFSQHSNFLKYENTAAQRLAVNNLLGLSISAEPKEFAQISKEFIEKAITLLRAEHEVNAEAET